ncbi:hypothetical protein J5N97_017628 [Dioscorea zingiberensis]|uniref:Aminotransferase class I/classII large domain-containing protein n=1 Tax=Dioscorea zingiberensis TaxID=325984 RepID=A0A9D5HGR4_9LILI|nr:hypothetical protein J5N97_017628 [Dioscorea zingiberensis]
MAPTTQITTNNGRDSSKIQIPDAKSNPHFNKEKTSIRGMVAELLSYPNPDKPLISLGVGDSSVYPCFHQGQDATGILTSAISSGDFVCYPPSFGLLPARRAVAEYLSWGVQQGIKEEDVYLMVGGTQAIQVCTMALAARSGANLLIPRPGFPLYEAKCGLVGIEPRFYDLVPENGWELDPTQLRAIANHNTVGLVVISPNNPCGVAYSSSHLLKIAETARDLNIPIIADEVYGHMVFGGGMFLPMASFAHIAPVITIGSLSKRWMIPGWRFGWLTFSDPYGSLKQVKKATEMLMNILCGPPCTIQGAVPSILLDTSEDFHKNVIRILESSADTLFTRLEQIEALNCYSRPWASMFMMIEVKTDLLCGIENDMDFARELMKEESVLVLPGTLLGLKNWVRIFFGVPTELAKEACERIESFCKRRLLLI